MEVFQTDHEGVFVGAVQADPDPLQKNQWLIPAGCVQAPPPAVDSGMVAVWVSGGWVVRQDRRGMRFWMPDGTSHVVASIWADVPADASWQSPAPPAAPTVPAVVSPFQARAALDEAGQLDTIEAYIAQPTTPRLVKLAWTQATEFRRGSLMLMNMALVLGMTQAQLDALFTRAAQIEV